MLAHSHLAEQTAKGHRSHFCRNEIIPPAAQPIAAARHQAWSWLDETQHRGTCAPLLTHITHRAAPLLTTTLQPPRIRSALIQKQRKCPEEKPSSPTSQHHQATHLLWGSSAGFLDLSPPTREQTFALLNQTSRAPPH